MKQQEKYMYKDTFLADTQFAWILLSNMCGHDLLLLIDNSLQLAISFLLLVYF